MFIVAYFIAVCFKEMLVSAPWRWRDNRAETSRSYVKNFGHKLFPPPAQCRHISFVDFVVLPPGDGRSVTDFWGWDAHEAQLRCPDGVSGDRGGCSARRGHLNSTNLPRPWSPQESSPSRKIPTVEPGIETGTSWLVVRDSDHQTTSEHKL